MHALQPVLHYITHVEPFNAVDIRTLLHGCRKLKKNTKKQKTTVIKHGDTKNTGGVCIYSKYSLNTL